MGRGPLSFDIAAFLLQPLNSFKAFSQILFDTTLSSRNEAEGCLVVHSDEKYCGMVGFVFDPFDAFNDGLNFGVVDVCAWPHVV